MNKKQLRYAFKVILEVADKSRCEYLHHTKKHQHKHDEMCKAEYHLQRQAYLLREYMKEQGI